MGKSCNKEGHESGWSEGVGTSSSCEEITLW